MKKKHQNNIYCIIPVRAELYNNNIFRILYSLAKQNIKITVVLIINNSYFDFQFESDIYKENLKTIKILKDLQNNIFDKKLKIIKKINSSKLILEIIDLTNGIEKNMGIIRNKGLDFVYNIDQDGFIFFLDADCIVRKNFVKNLITQFKKEIHFSIQPMIYFPFENDQKLLNSFTAHHLPLLLNEVSRIFSNASTSRLGGPQLAATIQAWKDIGSFPDYVDGEDFEAGKKLSDKYGINYNSNPESLVITADRAYDSGFEAGARKDGIRDNYFEQNIKFENPLFPLLNAILNKEIKLSKQQLENFKNEKDLFKIITDKNNINSENALYKHLEEKGYDFLIVKFSELTAIIKMIINILYPDKSSLIMKNMIKVKKIIKKLEKNISSDKSFLIKNLWKKQENKELYIYLTSIMLTNFNNY